MSQSHNHNVSQFFFKDGGHNIIMGVTKIMDFYSSNTSTWNKFRDALSLYMFYTSVNKA